MRDYTHTLYIYIYIYMYVYTTHTHEHPYILEVSGLKNSILNIKKCIRRNLKLESIYSVINVAFQLAAQFYIILRLKLERCHFYTEVKAVLFLLLFLCLASWLFIYNNRYCSGSCRLALSLPVHSLVLE